MKLGSIQNSKFKVVLILSTIYYLLSTSLGCEAFRKKFVRKPKKDKEVEVVVHTQEYVSEYSTEETYKKYFLFWRTWHEELLSSLSAQDGNRKKHVFTAKKIAELRKMEIEQVGRQTTANAENLFKFNRI